MAKDPGYGHGEVNDYSALTFLIAGLSIMGVGTLIACYFSIAHMRVIYKEGKQATHGAQKQVNIALTSVSSAIQSTIGTIGIELEGLGHHAPEPAAAPSSPPPPASPSTARDWA